MQALKKYRIGRWLRAARRRERLLAAALAGSLLLNLALAARPALADGDRSQLYQQTLEYVRYYMRTLYVDPIADEDLMRGAVRGVLASSQDPYTRFLDAEELREFSSMEEGRRVGIGVEVTLQDGIPVVIAPIGGGPAEQAGVQAGDRIVAIDGVKTEDQSFAQILQRIGGESGSRLELKIEREGSPAPIILQVTRGAFQIDYVRSQYFENEKVGYLRLLHFFGEENGAVEEFRTALEDFKRRGAGGIIVDLRNNPGGRLDMAATLAGYFLKTGELVVTARGRTAELSREYRVEGAANLIDENYKVIVLINEGSASASEIFAGALQDHHRAKLLGARSFGKASVQRVFRPLPGDTAALITVQRYFTPANRGIHGLGLTPDIVVESARLGPGEILYLQRLDERKYFEELRAQHPNYSEELVATLQSEFRQQQLSLSAELARLILRDRYHVREGQAANPDLDLQLARALQELH